MIINYFAAAILVTPLISMAFPAIDYWRSCKNETKVGPQGEKADYNYFFYLLVIGVFGMWGTWIFGIILLFATHDTSFIKHGSVGSAPVGLFQVIGLIIFSAGAVTYNLTIVAAGKYLRPAPAGTLDKHILIDKGPFALIRHPLYIAYLLINVGLSLTFLYVIPLFSAVLIVLGIYPTARAEEAVLVKQLGDKYIRYQQHVGMFFPRSISKSK
ncbi:methyltransferase family protein [Desulfobacter curvatus]|uniref:methyltransferase family protein n=1 Tax=Desulfobacter curvatus TaxID=2290 RepID=UPI00039EF3D5|nr:isoprenylcysteine carboxylmethyltransferase family protein [Desulfobacter curvatus]